MNDAMKRMNRAMLVVLSLVLVTTRATAEPLLDDSPPNVLTDDAAVCGDGLLGAGEECDDGNLADGDCCTSQCTVPPSCDDGSVCTVNDHCDAGVCVGDAVDCGRCRACDPQAGCHPAPAEHCFHSRAPWANRFKIRRGADPEGDRFVWSWRRGQATPPVAFGDPFTADDYTLCVFGRRGRDLLMSVAAPAGGTCGVRPCWMPRGPSGVRYADPSAPDGLVALYLDGGADGFAEIRARGKGAMLALPPPPLATPLTVQLQAGNGTCWEANFESRHIFQDDRQLRARGSGH
jgi:cysteine-rich repeat protein